MGSDVSEETRSVKHKGYEAQLLHKGLTWQDKEEKCSC